MPYVVKYTEGRKRRTMGVVYKNKRSAQKAANTINKKLSGKNARPLKMTKK